MPHTRMLQKEPIRNMDAVTGTSTVLRAATMDEAERMTVHEEVGTVSWISIIGIVEKQQPCTEPILDRLDA